MNCIDAQHWTMKIAVATAAALAAAICQAGQVTLVDGKLQYHEDFAWLGNHGATIGQGTASSPYATTVWAPEKDWSMSCRTDSISVDPGTDPDNPDPAGQAYKNTFHIDVHKAQSADPINGQLNNTVNTVGGDGTPGVGIIHVDFQDICGMRLRNPMILTSDAQPAVVSFYAPAFVTTGHWWEVSITKADDIVGAEHTAVPSVDYSLPFPNDPVNGQPGPGAEPPAASAFNVIAIGRDDAPCTSGLGWKTGFALSRILSHQKTDFVTQSSANFLSTDPNQANTLLHWRIEYGRTYVKLSADLSNNDTFVPVDSWSDPNLIPTDWNAVNVHLVGVAYQANHHPNPQTPCWLGGVREFQWRSVDVSPVMYGQTDVFPKNNGTDHVPQTLGFTHYDIRDDQRTGAVNGVAQANAGAFHSDDSGKYCNDAGYPCFGPHLPPALTLDLPASALVNLQAVNLVADIKRGGQASHRNSTASATVNGQLAGTFPKHIDVLTDINLWGEWVRRAVPVPVAALHAGTNTLNLQLDTGTYMDRIEFELLYTPSSLDDIFFGNFQVTAAGKSGRTAQAKAATPEMSEAQRQQALKRGITYPLVPVGDKKHLLHQCAD